MTRITNLGWKKDYLTAGFTQSGPSTGSNSIQPFRETASERPKKARPARPNAAKDNRTCLCLSEGNFLLTFTQTVEQSPLRNGVRSGRPTATPAVEYATRVDRKGIEHKNARRHLKLPERKTGDLVRARSAIGRHLTVNIFTTTL